jgi:hypothetical protein
VSTAISGTGADQEVKKIATKDKNTTKSTDKKPAQTLKEAAGQKGKEVVA